MRFSIALNRLLHLDANRLSAYVWYRGGVEPEAQFALDAGGQSAFAAYLRQHRASLFYLMADVAEEGFHVDTIPFVQGGDRRALIQRRLNQYFYGSTLVTALSLGRERSGRRDERLLFMALTRPQFFEPWLNTLAALESQLAGVYSIPLVSPALVSRLKLAAGRERLLLITLGSGGIRQTYFEGGNLRFSRLGALPLGGGADALARACAAESAKLYQYLVSQRMIARGSALPAVVLIHPLQRAAFAASCRSTAEVGFEFADLVHAASRCGMRGIPGDSFSDSLFLHLLAQRAPQEQFAGGEVRHLYRVWQAKAAFLAGSAAVLAGCLLYSGTQLYRVYALRQSVQLTQTLAEADARRYAQILAALPPMPVSVDKLRAVLGRFDALEHRSASPAALYESVSRALQAWPEINVDRIDWQLTGARDAAQRSTPPAPPAGAGDDMYASALVTCSLSPSAGRDQRAVLATIEGFLEALRGDPELTVSTTRMPFDVDPDKSLKSSDEQRAANAELRFVARLSKRL